MPARIGKQAVVVGAGVAGLTATRALADFFEHVIVLESDTLPIEAADRAGTPQCKHLHGLLPSGLQALSRLFPGFAENLSQAGAVSLRMGYDYRIERPGYDPFPQRDFGISIYSMTRPVLECAVRRRLAEYRNVELRDRCRVQGFVPAPGDGTVGAVRCENANGARETLAADLVIDASGHGGLTLALLHSIGWQLPQETSIGVDMGYATAVFDIPEDAPRDWMGAVTYPHYPRNKRAALILPVEGNRWILSLAGRYDEKPPGEWNQFLTFTQHLRTQTVYNAIRRAKRPSKIASFGLKASRWIHFERMETFPKGLVPLGDTFCRFNPIYGQGMSVAVLEAEVLHKLLAQQSGDRDGLVKLSGPFFAEAAKLIDTPWWSAAIPDFIDSRTEGQRPADFEETLKFFTGLLKLAAQDATVHKLLIEVQSLLKPRSEYRNPELVQRVKAIMAEAQMAAN